MEKLAETGNWIVAYWHGVSPIESERLNWNFFLKALIEAGPVEDFDLRDKDGRCMIVVWEGSPAHTKAQELVAELETTPILGRTFPGTEQGEMDRVWAIMSVGERREICPSNWESPNAPWVDGEPVIIL
jgi:hypothetical protein